MTKHLTWTRSALLACSGGGSHDVEPPDARLSHLRGNYQMPPLVSHQVDEEGTSSLAAWIDALPIAP
jgi:hypothetical protein